MSSPHALSPADPAPLRIALLQSAGHGDRPAANLDALAAAAARARTAGARLLVTPEAFLTGYAIGAARVQALAEPSDGPALRRVAEIARANGIGIVLGYPERAADDRVFNAAAFVDATGRLVANHRKTHLFGDLDREAFSPGDGPPATFTIGPLTAGILICYDIEFPENARLLALRGVDLLVVPTALMAPYDFIPRAMVATRAYENQVFLAYANRCGDEGVLHYTGESAIIGPDGQDLARAGSGESLILADLDLARLARSRTLNTYLGDRRPSLYGDLADPTPPLPGSRS